MKRSPCLNPFRTGQGLSTPKEEVETGETKVSIPLEQGRVFRLKNAYVDISRVKGLNPFRTGQGLSTDIMIVAKRLLMVSIPLEQGRVFRLQGWFGALVDKA